MIASLPPVAHTRTLSDNKPFLKHETPRFGAIVEIYFLVDRSHEHHQHGQATWTPLCAPKLTVSLESLTDTLLDGGYLPHTVIRMGIRSQLADRLRTASSPTLSGALERKLDFVRRLRERPIAIETDTANKQHYEVGTGVMIATLGPRMKYSSCLYPTGRETLAQAEEAMLESYVEKAELKDGMRILDLG